jgi:hypothetical protein
VGAGCAKGCGVGCGIVTLVAGVIVAIGVGWMRPALREIRHAEAAAERLDAAYGSVDSWTPDVARPLTAERVEVFLAARRGCASDAAAIEAMLADMPPDALTEEHSSARSKVGSVLRMLRRMIGSVAAFLAARDEALLEAGMGAGEYGWTYALVFHSWLGFDVDAGPVITKPTGEHVSPRTGERVFGDDHDRYSPARVRRAVRRLCVPPFRRMVEEARRTGDPRLPQLQAELARLESRPDAVPWEDGLPPELEMVLAPFRAELEASWRPVLHPFEVVHLADEDAWSRD